MILTSDLFEFFCIFHFSQIKSADQLQKLRDSSNVAIRENSLPASKSSKIGHASLHKWMEDSIAASELRIRKMFEILFGAGPQEVDQDCHPIHIQDQKIRRYRFVTLPKTWYIQYYRQHTILFSEIKTNNLVTGGLDQIENSKQM